MRGGGGGTKKGGRPPINKRERKALKLTVGREDPGKKRWLPRSTFSSGGRGGIADNVERKVSKKGRK